MASHIARLSGGPRERDRDVAPQETAGGAGRATIRAAGVLLMLLALAACQSLSDVRPGEGQSITVAGHPYDQVWDATLKVAEQHFTVLEQSRPEGIILAERSGTGGGWIGIYFTGSGPNTYRVEVVRKGRYAGQIAWTDWPRTVLREVQAALGQPPAR